MYIEPNTDLYILSGCPLNNNYEHTILFNSEQEQFAYFNSLAKYRLTKNSYVRYEDGAVKVQIKTEDLYDCDYLMFRNTSYGNKWFYAFIDTVEYVNNITSAVVFSIDVMQTWHFNYSLEQCYVDREHSATDVIGENTLPENLQIGDYITNAVAKVAPQSLTMWLYATELINPAPAWVYAPSILAGQPLPCYAYYLGEYGAEAFARLNIVIEALTLDQKANAVVSVFLQPNFGFAAGVRTTISAPAPELPVAVKNNKLYTYPYCMLAVQSEGSSATLKYELFTSPNAPTFEAYAVYGPSAQLAFTPLNYAGQDAYMPYQLTLGGFPILPWTVNAWEDWLARNKATLNAGAVGGAADLAAAGVTVGASFMEPVKHAKNPLWPRVGKHDNPMDVSNLGLAYGAHVVANTVGKIANTVAEVYNAYNLPNQMYGTAAAGEANVYNNRKAIYMYSQSIRPEYIRIVDEFFTMYGYATHRVKVPNRSARPRWNFTKTIGCLLNGSLPQDAADVIKAIYDRGVTFWKNPSEIGNYSLDNSV